MERRPLFRIVIAAIVLTAAGGLGLLNAGVRADTAQPGIAIEGWFARNKPRSPEVDTCPPPPLPPPPGGCGPVNPGEIPAPQSPDKGGYVTSSAGGDAGRSDASGDIGWAAFQWDLLSYLGATVSKFEVVLTQAPDNQGDTLAPWIIQACNIIGPWGAAAGSNPWPDRPTLDSSTCVVPKVSGKKFTFDFTSFARTWIEGTGYGVAIVPGTPTQKSNLPPFQITFAGYFSTAPDKSVLPKVAFEFSPAAGLDDFSSGGGFSSGGSTGGFGDVSSPPVFVPNPSVDVFPNDVGSSPLVEEVAAPTPAPTSGGGTPRPIGTSKDPGFPFAGWLLLPIGLALFWGTGTALGPAGDPVLPRRGGLSRLLTRRRETAALTPQGEQ